MPEQKKMEVKSLLQPKLYPEKYLSHFVKASWREIEKKSQLEWSWHLDSVCEAMQDVVNGKIKRLIINVPPRSLKSIIISACFVPWLWTTKPWTQLMYISSTEGLATKFSIMSRNIIESPWYQNHWKNIYKLSEDNNRQDYYSNNKQGHRLAFGINSKFTGQGANIVLIDDPNDVQDRNSPVKLEQAIDAFKACLSRLNDRRRDKIILIQQRVGVGDLTDYILSNYKDKWELLKLPLISEFPLCAYDKRTNEGESISPRFTPEVIEEIKESFITGGQAGDFDAQYQQNPSSEKNSRFKSEWFIDKYIDKQDLPFLLKQCRFYDFAATEAKAGKDPDYTVGLLLGQDASNNFYIIDVERFRLEPLDVETKIKHIASQDGLNVSVRIEEEKGSAGKHIASYYSNLLLGYDCLGSKIWADKITRSDPVRSLAKSGRLYVVRGHWNRDFIKELVTFPKSRHKDQVDALSGAFHEIISQNTNIALNSANVAVTDKF